jgi:hypothetical protein
MCVYFRIKWVLNYADFSYEFFKSDCEENLVVERIWISWLQTEEDGDVHMV